MTPLLIKTVLSTSTTTPIPSIKTGLSFIYLLYKFLSAVFALAIDAEENPYHYSSYWYVYPDNKR